MAKKAIINSGIGSKVICGVVDGTTLEALPIKATDNGDGTSGLQVVDATGNASLASIAASTYLGQDRTTTIGAAEELTIPAGALKVQLFCGVGCEAHIQLNADATTDSPSVEAPFPIPAIALGDVTKLSVWCVSGKMTAWFWGA